MSQYPGEWEALVSSEGPKLPTAGSDSRNSRGDKCDNYYSSHGVGAPVRVGGVVEDLDERRTSW